MRIGEIETGRDVLDAGRAVKGHRLAPARRPCVERDIGQAADMIGMKMGDEDAGQAADRQLEGSKPVPAAEPRIDHEELAAGIDGCTGLGPLRIGHGRTGAAKHDMQSVWREHGIVDADIRSHDAPHDGILRGR